jgi:hypothetical protein
MAFSGYYHADTATRYNLWKQLQSPQTATRYSLWTQPQYKLDNHYKSNPRPPPSGWLDNTAFNANQWSDTFDKANPRPPPGWFVNEANQWSNTFESNLRRYISIFNDISAWNDEAINDWDASLDNQDAILSRWSSSGDDFQAFANQDAILSRWSSSGDDFQSQDAILSRWSSSGDDFHASARAEIDPVNAGASENQIFLLNVDINGLWFILPCFVLWAVLAIYGFMRCKRRSKVNNSIMELNESFQDPEHVKYVASLTPADDDYGVPRSLSAERVYNML